LRRFSSAKNVGRPLIAQACVRQPDSPRVPDSGCVVSRR
jgi:hypothetical protein